MRILEQLRDLLPPLEDSEIEALEASIWINGILDPIQLGSIGDVSNPFILDGHNRYALCQKLNKKPTYSDNVLEFNDIYDVKAWILQNQLSRRNLNSFKRCEIVSRLEDNIREEALNRKSLGGKGGLEQDPHNCADLGVGETRQILAKQAGISHETYRRFKGIIKRGSCEVYDSLRKGDLTINKVYTDLKKEEIKEKNEELKKSNPTVFPDGRYQTIVIDPPWPMEKIQLDCRPDQIGFDYPTMNEEELKLFPLPEMTMDECHMYLWTTQKFFFMAHRLMEYWGFNYIFQMTWMKNGGFQPFGLPQYNTEFVLFGKKGPLPFVETKNFFTGFSAPRREHSRKPDEFYDVVKRVSPGPRIDVFSREKRDGFDQFGNEEKKLVQG